MAKGKLVGLPVDIHIVGINEALAAMSLEAGAQIAVATAKMTEGAHAIKEIAAANLSEHSFTGRAADAVEVFGPAIAKEGYALAFPTRVTVSVGIKHTNVPPFFVGATFENGWQSDTGKIPPIEPIARWVIARGIADTPAKGRSIAFAIARRQGEKGYTFGTFKWLSSAYAAVVPILYSELSRRKGFMRATSA